MTENDDKIARALSIDGITAVPYTKIDEATGVEEPGVMYRADSPEALKALFDLMLKGKNEHDQATD
jgi:hypothetical protein